MPPKLEKGKGYTLEELKAMGATPVPKQQTSQPLQKGKGYTLDELQAMGIKPTPKPIPGKTTILTPEPVPVTEKIAKFTGGDVIAKGFGQALANKKIQKNLDTAQTDAMNIQGDLIKRIREKKAKGEDTTRLEASLKALGGAIQTEAAGREKILNQNEITPRQVAGDALQVAGTIAGAGTYGKGFSSFSPVVKKLPTVASKMTKGVGFVKGAIQGAKAGAVTGAGYGALAGASQNLKNKTAAQGDLGYDILSGAAGGAAVGGVVGGLIGGVSGGIQKYIKNRRPPETADDAYELIKPKYTGRELKDRVKAGLVDVDEAGNYIDVMSPDDRRLAEVARTVVSPGKSTGKNLVAVKNTIKEISEKEVQPLLANSKVNGTLDDVYSYIDNISPSKQFGNEMSPKAFKTFETVKNDTKNEIARAIKAQMKQNPDINFNEALWRARQRIDDIINENFGKLPFTDISKNAATEAGVKSRGAVQSFIVDAVSGKDMSKMAQARSAIKEALSRGIEVPDGMTVDDLVEQYYEKIGGTPVVNGPSREFADKMKFLSDLYKIKDEYLTPRIASEARTKAGRFFKTPGGKFTKAVGMSVLGGGALVGAGAAFASE